MKKIKLVLSLVLVCAMLISTVSFSAGAAGTESFGLDNDYNIEPPLYQPKYIYDDNSSLSDVFNEFDEFCNYCNYYYPSYAYGVGIVGEPMLSYGAGSDELDSALSSAKDLYDSYFQNRKDIDKMPTIQDFRNAYKAVADAADNMCVSASMLNILVILCSMENNDNNYYAEALWNDFSKKLATAKEIVDDKSADSKSVDTAYWDLFAAMNRLCTANTKRCDVNNDGYVNIMDTTTLQKVIAGLDTFNFSQRFNAVSGRFCVEPTINDVTYLQKNLAGYDCSLYISQNFKYIQENPEGKLWRKNQMIYELLAPWLSPMRELFEKQLQTQM